jgi:hypothetical protein
MEAITSGSENEGEEGCLMDVVDNATGKTLVLLSEKEITRVRMEWDTEGFVY